MPLKVNVGLSKKIGLPDFGSLGATCNVEFEAESSLLQSDREAFQRHVRNAYVACAQAVNDELARQHAKGAVVPAANGPANGHPARGQPPYANGSRANGNGGSGRTASDKQLNFARQLSKAIQGLGIRRLDTLTQKMYGKPLAALTSMDASGLIDTLMAIKDGQISLTSVLGGEAA